jgi:cytoskeletal protein RodZ
VRIVLLIIVAVVFLTGIVWWVTFVGNTVVNTLRKR